MIRRNPFWDSVTKGEIPVSSSGVSLEARLEWIGAMATSGPPSLPLDVACLLVCLYRRVSTRERFGVWSPDGRSTPLPPSMIADPLGGSAQPVKVIYSRNLTALPMTVLLTYSLLCHEIISIRVEIVQR